MDLRISMASASSCMLPLISPCTHVASAFTRRCVLMRASSSPRLIGLLHSTPRPWHFCAEEHLGHHNNAMVILGEGLGSLHLNIVLCIALPSAPVACNWCAFISCTLCLAPCKWRLLTSCPYSLSSWLLQMQPDSHCVIAMHKDMLEGIGANNAGLHLQFLTATGMLHTQTGRSCLNLLWIQIVGTRIHWMRCC